MIPSAENIEKEIEDFLEEENKFKPYKAFKGFDKNLKCRDYQFELGGTYSKEFKETPKLCTNDGFHYCDELDGVFKHYSLNGGNRFCEIEILHKPTKDNEKCITTSFKILREIPLDEINVVIYEERLEIEKAKQFQILFPFAHVGGSTGLFLHGIKLKRHLDPNNDYSKDLDMVIPFYSMPDDERVSYDDSKNSGNDFDETIIFDGVKVDLKIDPKQKYEVIEYKGFKYKVSLLETILEAKIRYAANADGQKHKDDVLEILKKENEVTYTFDVILKMLTKNDNLFDNKGKIKRNNTISKDSRLPDLFEKLF